MLQVQIQDWKVHVNHMLFLSYGRDIKPRTPVNLLFKVALLLNFEENSTSPFYFEVAFLLNFKENFTSSSYLKSPSYQILRKIPHRPLIQSRPLIKFRGKFHVALLFEVTLLFERWEYPYFSWKVRYINIIIIITIICCYYHYYYYCYYYYYHHYHYINELDDWKWDMLNKNNKKVKFLT